MGGVRVGDRTQKGDRLSSLTTSPSTGEATVPPSPADPHGTGVRAGRTQFIRDEKADDVLALTEREAGGQDRAVRGRRSTPEKPIDITLDLDVE